MSLFAESEIVIIGGGAIGCGVAYSLASAGKSDVLLIEREGDVGQVTTAQGAGLCGQVRSSVERVRLAMHSVAHVPRAATGPGDSAGLARGRLDPPRVLTRARRGTAAAAGRLRAGRPGGRPDRPSRGRAALAAARSQRRPGGALVPLRRVHDALRGDEGVRAPVPAHGRALRDGDGGHGDHLSRRPRRRGADGPRRGALPHGHRRGGRARLSRRPPRRSRAPHRPRAARVLRHGPAARTAARTCRASASPR